MILDIEEIKNEIATALFNQCENTKWELGAPIFDSFARRMAEDIILITKLPTILAEYRNFKNNDKPICEQVGHYWITPTDEETDKTKNYVCRTCKKLRTKVRREVLVWED